VARRYQIFSVKNAIQIDHVAPRRLAGRVNRLPSLLRSSALRAQGLRASFPDQRLNMLWPRSSCLQESAIPLPLGRLFSIFLWRGSPQYPSPCHPCCVPNIRRWESVRMCSRTMRCIAICIRQVRVWPYRVCANLFGTTEFGGDGNHGVDCEITPYGANPSCPAFLWLMRYRKRKTRRTDTRRALRDRCLYFGAVSTNCT